MVLTFTGTCAYRATRIGQAIKSFISVARIPGRQPFNFQKGFSLAATASIVGAGLILSCVSECEGVIMQGDVAIVRVNAMIDGFSVVALRDIAAGEVLYATDDGWQAAGGFRTGEGHGDVSIISTAISKGTVFDVTSAGTSFDLSMSGDQVILFTGTLSSPTLIYAVDWAHKGWNSDATSSNTSADPAVAPSVLPALTDRLTVSIGTASAYEYIGTTTGTTDELLNDIGNAANWTATSDTTWGSGTFSVVPEPAASSAIAGVWLLALCGWRVWRQSRCGGKLKS